MAVVERFKQESMYGLSAKKSGFCREVAVVERWLLVGSSTVHCKLPLLQALANEDTDSRSLWCRPYKELTVWKYCPSPLPPAPLWAVHVPKSKVNNNKCYLSSLQYTSYPGFFPNEVTPLPGQLEAPQLLNRVTKAQCFPVSGCVA